MTRGNVRSNESTGPGAMCPALTPAASTFDGAHRGCAQAARTAVLSVRTVCTARPRAATL
eukprot:3663911-Prymnesium_polylepis.1